MTYPHEIDTDHVLQRTTLKGIGAGVLLNTLTGTPAHQGVVG